ncbi:carboxypeptidase-like regulatory domain-containing protein [Candidatus Altiarchaeota archaeon]
MRSFNQRAVIFLLITLLVLPSSAEDRDPCLPKVDYIDISFTEPSCDLSPGNWCGSYNMYCLEIKTKYLGQGIVNPILKTASNPEGYTLTRYERKIADQPGPCPGGEYVMSKCYEPTEPTRWDLEVRVRTEVNYKDGKHGRNYEDNYVYNMVPHDAPWPANVRLSPQQQEKYFNWCISQSQDCIAMSEEKFLKDVGYFSLTQQYIPCKNTVNGKKTGYSMKETPCNCCPPEELGCTGFHANLRVCEMYTKDISGGDCERLRYILKNFCMNQPGAEPVEDCANRIDDDNDNTVDCQDTDCANDPVCTPRSVTGTVIDNFKVPLPHVRVTLNWEGTDIVTYTDEKGKYAIPGGDTFVIDPKSISVARLRVELADEDKKLEVLDGSDGDKLVFIEKEFRLDKKEDLVQDFKFSLSNFAGITNSTNRTNLHGSAVIYHETMRAVRFYPKYLGERVDYQMPESVTTFKAGCSACHVMSVAKPITDHGIDYSYNGSLYTSMDRHDNREWHEFAHHMMLDMYDDFPSGNGTNHGMFNNSDTTDSWVEGFAIVMPLIMAAEFGEKNPEYYDWEGGASNLELNVKDGYDEEFCIAGIIWDLYDGKDALDDDYVKLGKLEFWGVIATKTDNLKDIYDKFRGMGFKDLDEDEDKDGISDLDEVFISHGVYLDKNKNGRYDANEVVGQGDITRPNRI